MMTFEEALEMVLVGRAVSRLGWADPSLVITLAHQRTGELIADVDQDPEVYAPGPMTHLDMEAEDWFVVGSAN